ncbi:MAG: phosphodiester glycosidase family protein [Hormoscilla sp.]
MASWCTQRRSRLISLFLIIIGLPLLWYGGLLLLRPPRTNQERVLFRGITYKRLARSVPRPLMIHIVTIDLTAPGINVFVTPGSPGPDRAEIPARTTSEFVREFQVQFAVNGSFFYPFYTKTPWDYYPRSGDRVDVKGKAIANGVEYSQGDPGWFALCFSAEGRAQITGHHQCPEGTMEAVAGGTILVWHGKQTRLGKGGIYDGLYPRTAVGIDKKGEKIWIIAIDGRQAYYSEGVSLPELADILIELGVETALNLDGGGSTTLVLGDPKPRVLNAPIHTRIPMRQRPVANHLGFYAIGNEQL